MDANNMPEARRVAIFLNCVGKTTYAIIRKLMIPDKPAEKSLKDIITVMQKHFEPKPLVIFGRFKFNKCVQLPSETVSEYVVELRKVSEHCKFEAFLDNGSQFAAQNFCSSNGIKHIRVTPYHPSSNGLAESGERRSEEAEHLRHAKRSTRKSSTELQNYSSINNWDRIH